MQCLNKSSTSMFFVGGGLVKWKGFAMEIRPNMKFSRKCATSMFICVGTSAMNLIYPGN